MVYLWWWLMSLSCFSWLRFWINRRYPELEFRTGVFCCLFEDFNDLVLVDSFGRGVVFEDFLGFRGIPTCCLLLDVIVAARRIVWFQWGTMTAGYYCPVQSLALWTMNQLLSLMKYQSRPLAFIPSCCSINILHINHFSLLRRRVSRKVKELFYESFNV